MRAMWVNSALVHGASRARPSSVYGRPYSGFQRVSYAAAAAAESVLLPVDSAPSTQTRLLSAVTAADTTGRERRAGPLAAPVGSRHRPWRGRASPLGRGVRRCRRG